MKLPAKVLHWDDERNIGNGHIVELKPGWRWEEGDRSHTRGFDTSREIREALRFVVKCECEECNAARR